MELKLLALIVAAALNPLVARTPEPHGIVPADCEVSDRQPMTRVAVAEPVVDDAVPLPPARSVTKAAAKTDVKPLQDALARNDRAAFDAALARAKEAGAPARVYEDIARVWDAQFEGPFFSQESEAYRIASGYPGYEAAVRRQILTDSSGRKFYPAAETRAFLGQQVGVAAPATTTRRASTTPRRVEPSPQRRSPTSIAKKRSSPSSSPTTSSTTGKSRKTAATRESIPPPRPSPDPSAATRPAAAAPAPVVPLAVDISSTTEAPPAAGSFAPAADTAATASDAPAPMMPTPVESAAEPAPSTPATTTAPATQPAKGRSIVLPAILILIGLGVLILLFRTAR